MCVCWVFFVSFSLTNSLVKQAYRAESDDMGVGGIKWREEDHLAETACISKMQGGYRVQVRDVLSVCVTRKHTQICIHCTHDVM